MDTNAKMIRAGAVWLGVVFAYTIAMGVVGGCGKKAADPAAAAPAASASPDASGTPSGTPSETASSTPSPYPTIAYAASSTSFKFAADGDYLSVADATNLNFDSGDAFSVSFWYKPTSFPANNQWIFSKLAGTTNTDLQGFAIAVGNDKKLYCNLIQAGSSGGLRIGSTSLLTTSSWTHVTFTYDGSKTAAGVKMYFNGADAVATVTSGTFPTTTFSSAGGIIRIGGGGTALSGPADVGGGAVAGNLDEVALWSAALSDTEIASLYNSGAVKDLSTHTKASKLVGWWRGEGDTAPTILDHAGLATRNNGTLVGNVSLDTDVVGYVPPPVVFTSDSFDSVGGRSTFGTTLDALVGGTTKTWVQQPGESDTWNIGAGLGLVQIYASQGPANMLLNLGSAPSTCTVRMKLAVAPQSGKFAGIHFRTDNAGAQIFYFVYDNGQIENGVAGYKVFYSSGGGGGGGMPVLQVLPTPLPTAAVSNDEMKVVFTQAGYIATVTPSGGAAVSSSFKADTNGIANRNVGISTTSTTARFDDFIVQDCQ